MSRTVQEPVITHEGGPMEGDVYEHPAYGQIGASRVTGGAVLYGSDFLHQQYIRIRISESKLRRSLSNDWPSAGRAFVEVDLSEAQWATFVSSMNIGSGVQCTIASRNCQSVPQLPNPINRTEQFSSEVTARMQRGMGRLNELEQVIAGMGLTQKKQAELLSKLTQAKNDLGANLGYVADQFVEHMDATKERAKVEINAHLVNAVTRAGLEHLGASSSSFLQLPDSKARHDEPAS